MSLKYNHNNVALARELRKSATPQEKKLWHYFLSTHSVRFQRQKPIDNFIVDFYCAKAKLVIELDGSQHGEEENLTNDANRTQILESYGIQVVRFTNYDVDTNFNAVCEEINRVIELRLKSTS